MEPDDVQHLKAIIGCIEGFVLEYDGDARCAKVWAVDESFFRVAAADIVGKTFEDLLGREAAPVTAFIKRVHDTGKAHNFETRFVVDGKKRWFTNDLKRVPVPGGHHIIMMSRDITDRKAAEAALRASEERYRLAEQATNDVLWDWNYLTGEFTWSSSAARVFVNESEAPDLAWWIDRIHVDDKERTLVAFDRAIEGGAESWSGNYRMRRADGRYVDLLARAFIVRKNERPVRIIGSWIDLTEMTSLQAQLVQSDRLAALGLLAAGVGHEINNPLCYVRGNLELALDAQGLPPDELREVLIDARDGADRIAEIVKGLRLFSRSDPTVTTKVSLANVLDRSLRMAENELRHRARLLRAYGEVPAVDVSETQLGQVCLNLIVNAAQAIPAGNAEKNEVRVTTGVDERGRAFFAVRDTGSGIAAEHLDRIFDPFFTTKPMGQGTGIGLAVCMSIVQSMGGELTVKSQPGEGTEFTVSLPTSYNTQIPPSSVQRRAAASEVKTSTK